MNWRCATFKEVSGRRSVVDTGKSCIPTEIPSDLKFFFSYGIVAPPHPRSLYEFKNLKTKELLELQFVSA